MMTADTLTRQYQSNWPAMSPRQQAAFRANVTWLLKRTFHADELTKLYSLRQAVQPAGSSRPAERQTTAPRTTPPRTPSSAASEAPTATLSATHTTSPRRYALSSTRLELRRTRISVADTADTAVLGEKITANSRAAAIAHQLIGGQAQEHLLLLLLDTRNTITGVHTVHIGTTNQCIVEVGDILRVALLANAPSIILAHNHPSGNPEPSPQDIAVTRDIAAAAQLVNVSVLDHVIVTDDPKRYTSLLATQGSIFNHRYKWA